MTYQQQVSISTKAHGHMHDLTEEVTGIVRASGVRAGTVTVFTVGSTAAVGTIEFEPGLERDLPEILDKLIPPSRNYGHEQAWHDGNGHSHLQATLSARKAADGGGDGPGRIAKNNLSGWDNDNIKVPTVLTFAGFRVVIYPNDHRPAHVHVIGPDCEAVFKLNCPSGPVSLRENYRCSRSEIARMERELRNGIVQLCKAWQRVHGQY